MKMLLVGLRLKLKELVECGEGEREMEAGGKGNKKGNRPVAVAAAPSFGLWLSWCLKWQGEPMAGGK